MEIYSNEIFNYLINNELDDFFNYIKKDTKKDLNLDIFDKNKVYVIQYIVNYNRPDILEYILKNYPVRIDILDNDGRNILYYPIKYNFLKMIEIILFFNKNNIGVNLIDLRDKFGFTILQYSCLFNNLSIFKKYI